MFVSTDTTHLVKGHCDALTLSSCTSALQEDMEHVVTQLFEHALGSEGQGNGRYDNTQQGVFFVRLFNVENSLCTTRETTSMWPLMMLFCLRNVSMIKLILGQMSLSLAKCCHHLPMEHLLVLIKH
eukprot:20960-Heterococcus_DN1.PRE.1